MVIAPEVNGPLNEYAFKPTFREDAGGLGTVRPGLAKTSENGAREIKGVAAIAFRKSLRGWRESFRGFMRISL